MSNVLMMIPAVCSYQIGICIQKEDELMMFVNDELPLLIMMTSIIVFV